MSRFLDCGTYQHIRGEGPGDRGAPFPNQLQIRDHLFIRRLLGKFHRRSLSVLPALTFWSNFAGECFWKAPGYWRGLFFLLFPSLFSLFFSFFFLNSFLFFFLPPFPSFLSPSPHPLFIQQVLQGGHCVRLRAGTLGLSRRADLRLVLEELPMWRAALLSPPLSHLLSTPQSLAPACSLRSEGTLVGPSSRPS